MGAEFCGDSSGHASVLLWGLNKGLSLCLPELCIFNPPVICIKSTGMVQQEAEQGGLWDCGTRVHARRLTLEFCFLYHIDTVCSWHRLHTDV